ncbi:MAG: ABC transporter ATP-binding protein [Chromatiales bacterium]|jgi:ABC-2 type transport system ATP-binding protein
MQPVISISGLNKVYKSGYQALKEVNLEIEKGEIFALLGPNGAGKTTLISIICGIVQFTDGKVLAGGHDIIRDYRKSRSMIGLVPQELTTDAFETVRDTVSLSRGLFGREPDPQYIERVMIAKALSHEPEILFLDEPTAGVDVELRRDMWEMIRGLREQGVTIILTTHYIEEAEEMADRIGIINRGEIILVEEKLALMEKLGKRELRIVLAEPMGQLPESLAGYGLEVVDDGRELHYSFDAHDSQSGIPGLLKTLQEQEIDFVDIHSRQSSLEEIFVDLVSNRS